MQRRFVEAYLLKPNATQAAIKAGYSAKTAASQGERLLRNVEVQAELNRHRAASADATQMTVASVTARLLGIAAKAEEIDTAPGLSVARAAVMDAAKLNGLVVESSEIVTRSPEERADRLAALKAERERLARTH
jgi:phage terminase small subunit